MTEHSNFVDEIFPPRSPEQLRTLDTEVVQLMHCDVIEQFRQRKVAAIVRAAEDARDWLCASDRKVVTGLLVREVAVAVSLGQMTHSEAMRIYEILSVPKGLSYPHVEIPGVTISWRERQAALARMEPYVEGWEGMRPQLESDADQGDDEAALLLDLMNELRDRK